MRFEPRWQAVAHEATALAYEPTVRMAVLKLVLHEAVETEQTITTVLEALVAGHIGPRMRTQIDAWLGTITIPRERVLQAAQQLLDDRQMSQPEFLLLIEGFGPYPTNAQVTDLRQYFSRYSNAARDHQKRITQVLTIMEAKKEALP